MCIGTIPERYWGEVGAVHLSNQRNRLKVRGLVQGYVDGLLRLGGELCVKGTWVWAARARTWQAGSPHGSRLSYLPWLISCELFRLNPGAWGMSPTRQNFLLVTCYFLLVIRNFLLVTRYFLLVTRCFYSLLVTFYSLLVTFYLLFVTFYSLLVTFYSLLVAFTRYSLRFTRYLLLFTLSFRFDCI